MEFGKWLAEERNRRQITVTELAHKSRIDIGTISRLENSHNEVTLPTAVLLSLGLELDISTVFRGITGAEPPALLRTFPLPAEHPERRDVLGSTDIEAFISVLDENPKRIYKVLSELYSLVSYQAPGRKGDKFRSYHDLGVAVLDIRSLLLPSPVYSVTPHYPPVPAEFILQLYLNDGIVTYADAGAFVRETRQQRGERTGQVSAKADLSPSTLNRFEAGVIEHMKLTDVLVLDKHLAEYGEILGMYWKATVLQLLLSGTLDKSDQWPNLSLNSQAADTGISTTKAVNTFVFLCRWLDYLQEDTRWLHNIREHLS